jgi:hypothetical protein
VLLDIPAQLPAFTIAFLEEHKWPLIAGNRKIHRIVTQLCEIDVVAASMRATLPSNDILVCLPSTLITSAEHMAADRFAIGDTVRDFVLQGDSEKADELLSMLNPIRPADSTGAVHRYKVEPYEICAYIYSDPLHFGRGGWPDHDQGHGLRCGMFSNGPYGANHNRSR